jgi:hypothetical protein
MEGVKLPAGTGGRGSGNHRKNRAAGNEYGVQVESRALHRNI